MAIMFLQCSYIIRFPLPLSQPLCDLDHDFLMSGSFLAALLVRCLYVWLVRRRRTNLLTLSIKLKGKDPAEAAVQLTKEEIDDS